MKTFFQARRSRPALYFPPQKNRPAPVTGRQRGAALPAALVCILLIAMFSAALVKNLTLRQRSLDWTDRELQCQYLLTSAIDRARSRSAAEPNYRGEIWTPALADTVSVEEGSVEAGSVEAGSVDEGSTQIGRAEIRVEEVAGEPSHRLLFIQAHWPDDPIHRVQRTTRRKIHLPNPGAAL